MKIDKKQWKWTREPKAFSIEDDRVPIDLKKDIKHFLEVFYGKKNLF